MTRDEWVMPPAGTPFRRADVITYYEKDELPGWVRVLLARNGVATTVEYHVPLAEFEALLFGPAEGGEYTRAAEAWAEASIAAQRLWNAVMDGTIADAAAAGEADVRVGVCRDAFLRLYRERHDAQR